MNQSYSLRGVGIRYGTVEVLSSVDLDLCAGQLTGLLGPNGAGKSTLMGVMAGLRPHYLGSCVLDGRELRQWPRREFARLVSFVPQTVKIEFPFTAEQVVLMGRTPHCAGLFESEEDWSAVERAIEMTDTAAFRHRDFRTLSGGERQRVIVASALAQSPQVLLLDEPAAFLDLGHQISLYRLLRDLSRQGLLVVTVTHDLNLASSYCDRTVVMSTGRVVADAPPAEALTAQTIERVYHVAATVRRTETGAPWILYG